MQGSAALTPQPDLDVVHASAVAIAGCGVIILGASGSGKSGLALRLMALGATLVADDRVSLRRCDGGLWASAPDRLRGLIEARGIGILRVPVSDSVRLALAVDLDRSPEARLPQSVTFTRLGVHIRLLSGRDVPNLDSVLMALAHHEGVEET